MIVRLATWPLRWVLGHALSWLEGSHTPSCREYMEEHDDGCICNGRFRVPS